MKKSLLVGVAALAALAIFASKKQGVATSATMLTADGWKQQTITVQSNMNDLVSQYLQEAPGLGLATRADQISSEDIVGYITPPQGMSSIVSTPLSQAASEINPNTLSGYSGGAADLSKMAYGQTTGTKQVVASARWFPQAEGAPQGVWLVTYADGSQSNVLPWEAQSFYSRTGYRLS